MFKKKAFILAMALIASVSSAGCSALFPEPDTNIPAATAPTKKADSETQPRFDTMEYADAYCNTVAKAIAFEARWYPVDPETTPGVIYANMRDGGEFGNYLVSQFGDSFDGDIEYVLMFDKDGRAETTLTWIDGTDTRFVGCYGKAKNIGDLDADDWDGVLKHFGFSSGKFSGVDIGAKK